MFFTSHITHYLFVIIHNSFICGNTGCIEDESEKNKYSSTLPCLMFLGVQTLKAYRYFKKAKFIKNGLYTWLGYIFVFFSFFHAKFCYPPQKSFYVNIDNKVKRYEAKRKFICFLLTL